MLYIVSTPIGNLGDISHRAIEILKESDVIISEDTRRSKILFNKYGINPKSLLSFHARSSEAKVHKIIELLKSGKNISLISEAGTPGISDPGFLVIKNARKEGIKISPIPGASAFLSALSASGFPTDKFVFYGFLPQKKGKNKIFEEISLSKKTSCFYESQTRIKKTLKKMDEFFPERLICTAREITKIYEEFSFGRPLELLGKLPEKPKGEFVVLVSPVGFSFG